MAKLFYSFKDDELYQLMKECSLDTLMKEQCVTDGLLIWTHDGVVETVLYTEGEPRWFETRIFKNENGRYIMEHRSPGRVYSANIGEGEMMTDLARDILSWHFI